MNLASADLYDLELIKKPITNILGKQKKTIYMVFLKFIIFLLLSRLSSNCRQETKYDANPRKNIDNGKYFSGICFWY